MYSSLDRLITLAKKTGDRLIVHDEFMGHDVVIMDVDQYEKLWDRGQQIDQELEDEFGYDEELAPWEKPWDREHNDDWHHIGDVMNSELRTQNSEPHDFDWDFENDDIETGNSKLETGGELSNIDKWNFDEDDNDENEDELTTNADGIKIEDLSPDFDFGLDDFGKQPVPHKVVEGGNLIEEPLSDEPVFYEEPV